MVASLGASGALTGCPQPCSGPGCNEEFAGARVGLISNAAGPGSPTRSPLDAFATVSGTEDQGSDWDVAFAGDQVIAGSPGDGRIRSFSLWDGAALAPEDALGTAQGEADGDGFGASLAVVPDADGDGADDLLVGAPVRAVSSTSGQDGAVYLFSGLGAGWSTDVNAADSPLRSSGEHPGERLGEVVAGCPDIDGDGLGEWLAAAPFAPSADGQEYSGRVALGASASLGPLGTRFPVGALGTVWTGTDFGERAGSALSCAHDLVGPDGPDGVPDVAIGAPFADTRGDAAGAVYLLAGGPEMAGGSLDGATVRIVGTEDEEWLGWSVSTGDVDGDGVAELAAGAPGADAAAGQVRVWDGLDVQDVPSPLGSFRVGGAEPGDALGRSVLLRDLDQDGHADLVCGAPRHNPTEDDADDAYNSGALYLFLGEAEFGGWRPQMDVSEANISYVVAGPYLRTGELVAAGDGDGDGKIDLALLHRTEVD